MFWLYAGLWFVGLCVFIMMVFNKSKEGDELEDCFFAGGFYVMASFLAIFVFKKKSDWRLFMENWYLFLCLVLMTIFFGWLTVRILLRKNKIDVKDRPPIP